MTGDPSLQPTLQNSFKAVEDIEFPGSALSLHSRFYIERPPCETLAYRELCQPGSLIRIRAPRKMGKSSLMMRSINQAVAWGYRTVTIDFQQADTAVFQDSHKFLRWLCTNVVRQLNLSPHLDDYWDEEMGSKVSCTIYFEGYLFEQIETPLVLVLNEVNRLFEFPNIAQDFFPLLRSWHEQARRVNVWQKLRLVLVHSTEIYVDLNINQSPFNVGLTLKLPEFTWEQVQDLAQRYGLHLSKNQIQKLTNRVGGHPYLVDLALYHLCRYQGTLEELLQAAPTQTGIYRDHLRNLWSILQKQPELLAAFQQVLTAGGSSQLNPVIAYQLESLGLIKLEENNCLIFCELYSLYFSSQNPVNEQLKSPSELSKEVDKNIYSLVYLDYLTQVANRRQFDRYLEIQWQCLSSLAAPLSLIFCDIDYFKIYNESYGYQAGEDCLRQVAQAISQVVNHPDALVARYEGEEFAIILPQTDAREALNIAEKIRLKIKKIALPITSKKFMCLPNSVVTVSLGIAATIPTKNQEKTLISEAKQAVEVSKKKSGNIITISSVLNFRY